MKKVLCLFDYGATCFTGYATVSRNIVAQLKAHFGDNLHLDICAINNFDKPTTEYGGTVKVVSGILSQEVKPYEKPDDFGRMTFLKMLNDNDYDGVFIINDLGAIAAIVCIMTRIKMEKRKAGRKSFKSIIYFPIDGKIQLRVKNTVFDESKLKTVPKEYRHLYTPYINQLDVLDFFEVIVTYTNFARDEIVKNRPSLKDRVNVIYHGINTKDFFPIPENYKFKKQYFGKNADKFIVGVVNRNQARKDIPTAIYGFIEARKTWPTYYPKPFLYLHMDPVDPKGWDLTQVLSHTNLVEGVDYMFPQNTNKHVQVEVEVLNKIYNCFDVYLSTARGGGWELPVTESMACKVPCIIPDHTSLAEIGADGERAFMIWEQLPVCDVSDNMPRYMSHFEEVSENILNIAKKSVSIGSKINDIQPTIENAYNWITELTWEKVCVDWIEIFNYI